MPRPRLTPSQKAIVNALANGYTHLTLRSTAALAGLAPSVFRLRMRYLLWGILPEGERRWYFDWKAERWAIFEALGIVDKVKSRWYRRGLGQRVARYVV